MRNTGRKCGNVEMWINADDEGGNHLLIYNNKYIAMVFPNLRTKREVVKIRGGKYHLSGIGRLGKNSQFSGINQK
jgi:hypothetical protein